jgi:hypothetical protein
MVKDEELLEEDYSQYEEDVEQKETKEEESTNNNPSFKEIVINECKRIITQYKELMKDKNDIPFIVGIDDANKNEDECVNYIMNNLVATRTIGGADSVMYPYIHDYYVDNLDKSKVKDNWSNRINNNAAQSQPKVELSEKQKEKLLEKAKEQFIQEQKRKLEEEEKKRLEKEQKRLEKQKEREAEKEVQRAIEKQKAIEEAKKKGGAEQMSLFDL